MLKFGLSTINKLLIILCLLTWNTFSVNAQEDEGQNKIEELFSKAEKYAKSNYIKAASFSQEAYDLAKKEGDEEMQALIALFQAKNLRNQKAIDKSTKKYMLALEHAKNVKDYEVAIEAVDILSKFAYQKKDPSKSYQLSKDIISVLKSMRGDPGGKLSKLKADIAKLSNENRQLKKAIEGGNVSSNDSLALTQDIPLESSEALKGQLESARLELEELRAEKAKEAKRRKKTEAQLSKMSKEEVINETLLAQAKLKSEEQRNLSILLALAAGFIFILLLIFLARLRSNKKAKKNLEAKNILIEKERERSDELLLNILPENIAHELKANGKAKARGFNSVSILFTDFKNFSQIAESLTAEELVYELDHCFKAFDYIIAQYPSLEKIKTIGDSYMCAHGLSDRPTAPNDLVNAALEIQEFLEDYKQDRIKKGKQYFSARIGIHTGKVVAGVVGFNKFAYDIWGDTVNLASRMESSGEVGKVNISESTYNKVKSRFKCEYRGKIAAKNKGNVDMYFVRKLF